ncbi:MAG: sigma-70 family RNA polymerase sigma factor [Clostridiaceae bacterium]|nr:sigma-70 family RNA polymerase sigma factor [Clostridiaceae bacterium]
MFTQKQNIEEQLTISVDDDSAFVELYNSYFPRVSNYVHYRVDDFHEADDLTSQIFTKLFIKLEYYLPEKAPLPVWIFSIARNSVTDYYRSRNRNTYVFLEETAELSDLRFNLDDAVVSRELRQYLHRALASLSEREQEIIALKFWSGCTNRDIAKFIGISESNTGVILFRAMRRLRQILESWGINIDD